ncbi:4-oxalomesaconate tautomerase [Plastorhodobacter daqingensis]|uniref:4-oxalomesaconate tautomerase n=1 Tax=Plastorhodobacter daqingensis TaxID=1387281 RepID=A0ABW2UHP9_9RHOB
MTDQIAFPCILMRGGSSKGPYFRLSDLPADKDQRARVLLAAMGSPDARQIDGLGGADPLTSKVAMVAPSEREDADVDYHFAQVLIDKAVVDTNPSCGNMLSGVGPFAIESGMVAATGSETRVRIYEANTGSRIEAVVQTRDGKVVYDGDAEIAGVPGTAAPVRLNFMDITGSKTGALLPTGKLREEIDGVEVTLIDVSVPMMMIRAADLGKTGYETPAELNADTAFFARIEALRLEAGRRMGLGDVSGRVVPKVAILSEPRQGGNISARYFVPDKTHAAMAVTGGTCIATVAMLEGSVSDGLARRPEGDDRMVVIEHPAGVLEVALTTTGQGDAMDVVSAGVIRTARKLMAGEVFVPAAVLA